MANSRRSRSSPCITKRGAVHSTPRAKTRNAWHSHRRRFLVSACGAATTLLGMNEAYARNGRTGGLFDVPAEAARDLQLARSTLDGSEFIFDVQGHFVNPTGAWTKRLPPGARPLQMPKTSHAREPRARGNSATCNASGPTSSSRTSSSIPTPT